MLTKSHALLLALALIGLSNPLMAYTSGDQQAPDNMVEFTCDDFATKAKNCESYSCQTASVQDPTLATDWQIIEKKKDRCIISYTNNDVGLKDSNGVPKPITKTCEYDVDGIAALSDLMDELSTGYLSSIDEGTLKGTHNCSITSNGESVKPRPYSYSNDG